MKPSFPVLFLVSVLWTAGCASSSDNGVTREAAVERARQEVTFEPETTTVEAATSSGRPVWRVTFRSPPLIPGQPLREVLVVVVDRRTGRVVELARS